MTRSGGDSYDGDMGGSGSGDGDVGGGGSGYVFFHSAQTTATCSRKHAAALLHNH